MIKVFLVAILFFTINYSFAQKSEGIIYEYTKNQAGIDYHLKSDNHVITLMSNNFQNDYIGGFNNVSLRYALKF